MKLYPHNQKAYNEALLMFKNKNKVAIVQATGSGKGVLASKFISDAFKSKNILLMAPNKDILINYENSLGVEDTENVRTLTYPGLLALYKRNGNVLNEIAQQYDLLIIDEYHRLGAELWGTVVKQLIGMLDEKGSKILGLSATPIRYLDKNRDMSEELFENNVIYGVTLDEAVIDGILPTFKYIVSLFDYDSDLKDMIEQYENILKSRKLEPGVKKEIEKNIKKLNMQGSSNDVLRETVQKEVKYLSKPQKWIVFCSCLEDMQDAAENLEYWFNEESKKCRNYEDLTDGLNLFYIGSKFKNQDNECCLNTFYKANRGINVIVCVNKLNEGAHIENIDGIFMLRGTISPIIYLQQIGRALSAGSKKKPIIFDFINNYNNINKTDIESDNLVKDMQNFAEYVNRKKQEILLDLDGKEKNNDFVVVRNTVKPLQELYSVFSRLVKSSYWDEYETKTLIKYYGMKGPEYVATLLPKRTIAAIKEKAKQYNLEYNFNDGKVVENLEYDLVWSDEEYAVIERVFFTPYYKNFDFRTKLRLCKGELKHRTVESIKTRYEKMRAGIGKETDLLRNGFKWDKNDLIILKDGVNHKIPVWRIADELSRSVESVKRKMRREGLVESSNTFKEWTEEEKKYLYENRNLPLSVLSEKLNRSESSITSQKRRIIREISVKSGLKKENNQMIKENKNWTEFETYVLHENLDKGLDVLENLLPRKSKDEIKKYILKVYNLKVS